MLPHAHLEPDGRPSPWTAVDFRAKSNKLQCVLETVPRSYKTLGKSVCTGRQPVPSTDHDLHLAIFLQQLLNMSAHLLSLSHIKRTDPEQLASTTVANS